jgi:hypothetical protein
VGIDRKARDGFFRHQRQPTLTASSELYIDVGE